MLKCIVFFVFFLYFFLSNPFNDGVIKLFLALCLASVAFAQVTLTGAGATMPEQLVQRWMADFSSDRSVKMSYDAIGSGRGIAAFLAGDVDFAISEVFLSDEQMADMAVAHIPLAVGAVAVTYRLPNNVPIRLTGKVLSDIYAGRIINWQDDAIALLNPRVSLPDLPIQVLFRRDDSGIANIFRLFLSTHVPSWASRSSWPVGRGVIGNKGMSDAVYRTMGSIGFVALNHAIQNRLSIMPIQNRQGVYVKPDAHVLSMSAHIDVPDDLRMMVVNSAARYAYPIAGLSWMIVREDMVDQSKKEALMSWLDWIVTHGQNYHDPYHMGPLPRRLKQRVIARVQSLHDDASTR